jgi:hypothetical protein
MDFLAVFFCLICAASFVAIWASESGNKSPNPRRWLFSITTGILFIISGALSVATPTNSELAVILGGYYAANNKEFSELPSKSARVINKFLDSYLEDGDSE